ncbi:MAG TPA: hypothetical protein VJN67_06170 [Stellaceae bacterium]|nr:hypothetical protein [Stellaceae bacterium]
MVELAAVTGTTTSSDRRFVDHLRLRRPVGLRECSWLAAVGLISCLLCTPFIRSVYWLSDEGVLLEGGVRLLHGNKLYVDFFEFIPPGGFLVTAAWLKLMGASIVSVRILVMLTVSGIACFTYLACREASGHAPSSALIALGWVVASQGVWTQLSHHSFTTLFSVIAAWATISNTARRPRRWVTFLSGMAAGAAALVTPTRGAFAMVAAAVRFLDFRLDKAELARFLLGCASIPICIAAYLIANGELSEFFRDAILFPATRYASIQGVPFGYWADGQSLVLTYMFHLAALLTLLACVRDWRTFLQDRLTWACAAFALAGFIGCFPRPDAFHIGFAVPLACPLIAYCVSRFIARWRQIYRSAAAVAAIVIYMPVIPYCEAAQRAFAADLVPTPRGNVSLPNGDDGSREAIRSIAATPPQDAFFFYPSVPMLIFLTGREHVSRYDFFVPEYTLPSQYQEACTSALHRATWLVLDGRLDEKGLKQIYPAMQNPRPEETKRFEEAITSAFDLVAREGAFEIRRRAKAITDTVCNDIAQ